MEEIKEGDASMEIPVSGRVCVICADKAVACNFGAVTCESCKAFFRRNAHKENLPTSCKNDCKITKKSRSSCKSCRLKKCFNVGMDKGLIWSDTEKQKRKMKIEENKMKRYKETDLQQEEHLQSALQTKPNSFQAAFINSIKCNPVDNKKKSVLPLKRQPRKGSGGPVKQDYNDSLPTIIPLSTQRTPSSVHSDSDFRDSHCSISSSDSQVLSYDSLLAGIDGESGLLTENSGVSLNDHARISPKTNDVDAISDADANKPLDANCTQSRQFKSQERSILLEKAIDESMINHTKKDTNNEPGYSTAIGCNINIQLKDKETTRSHNGYVTACKSNPCLGVLYSNITQTYSSDNVEEYEFLKLIATKLAPYSKSIPDTVLNTMDTQSRVQIQQLMRAFEVSFDQVTVQHIKEEPTIAETFNQLEGFIKKTVKFAKNLSGFMKLNQSDQLALVKGSFVEVNTVNCFKIFIPESRSFVVIHRQPEEPDKEVTTFCKAGKALSVFEEGNALLTGFEFMYGIYTKRALCDQAIGMFLIAYILFTQRPQLKYCDSKFIQDNCDMYLTLLRKYIDARYTKGEINFDDVSALVPLILKNCSIAQNALEKVPLSSLSPLTKEMFNMN